MNSRVVVTIIAIVFVACSRSSEPAPVTSLSTAPTTSVTTQQATTLTTITEFDAPLVRLAPPAFDLAEWRQALTDGDVPGYGDPTPVAEVGDRVTFFYADGSSTVEVPAQLVYANDVLAMWFADDVFYDLDSVTAAADRFVSGTLPIVTELIGPIPAPGVDNDHRVAILHLNELVDAVGEFASYDLLPQAAFADSNQREMLYIAGDLEPGSDLYLGTLTHELTHLIDHSYRANRPLWLAEGLAQLAEHAAGFDTVITHLRYLAKQPVQLNDWGPLQIDDRHYGAAYLAMVYLWEQHGPGAIRTVLTSDLEGLGAIGEALAERNVDLTDFFGNFMVAVATDHEMESGFRGLELPRQCGVDHVPELPWTANYTLPQFAPRYMTLTGSGLIEVQFDGSSMIGPIDDLADSGKWIWWAGPSDESAATLTSRADLTSLSNATLRFSMWFDTGYTDSAVVMVSMDDGESWTVVSGAESQPVEIGSEPAGSGYTGWSGSGDAPSWVSESVDLSAYTGREILVRFQYTTDLFEGRVGFALDDIGIVQLEQLDGAESVESLWVGAGFQRTPEAIPQPWIVQVVNGNSIHRADVVDGTASFTVDLGEGGNATIGVAAVAPGTGARASFDVMLTGDGRLQGPPAVGEVDSFDIPCNGWELESTPDYELTHADGRLHVTSYGPNGFTWSAREGVHDVVTIATNMTFGQDIDGAGGVMCRLSSAGFYEVNIADDGQFIVGVAEGLDYETLVDWSESSAINTGPGADNQVRLECGDGTIVAFVNGVEIATISDDRLPPGRVAVVGVSYSAERFGVSYDNVIIEPRPHRDPSGRFDAFDARSEQWGSFTDRGSSIRIRDGEYVVRVSAQDWSAEAYSLDEFTEVSFSADFSIEHVAPDGLIGGTCHTTRKFSQYLFLLSFDGSFAVQAVVGSDFVEIVPWTQGSGLLIEPDAVNHMTITCSQGRLLWVLNGVTLADELDSAIEGGRIGFVAFTYEYGNLEMRIDNVLVTSAAP